VGFLINHRKLLIQNTTVGHNLKVSHCHHVYTCHLAKKMHILRTGRTFIIHLRTIFHLHLFNCSFVITCKPKATENSPDAPIIMCHTIKLLYVTLDVFRISFTMNTLRTPTLSDTSIAATSTNSRGCHVVFEVVEHCKGSIFRSHQMA